MLNVYKEERIIAGKTITLENVPEHSLAGLKLYGKSTQIHTAGDPDYPQEIVISGADGNIEVGVYGKNLLPPITNTIEKGGLAYTPVDNGGIHVTGTRKSSAGVMLVNKKMNGTFTLSFGGQNSNVIYYVAIGNSIGGNAIPPYTFSVENENVQINLKGRDNRATDEIVYPMMNVGESALPYEPYKQPQSLTLSTPGGLPGIQVTDASVANYTDADEKMWICDEIDCERGVYIKRVQKITYNSKTDVKGTDTAGKLYLLKSGNTSVFYNDSNFFMFMCDRFPVNTLKEARASDYCACAYGTAAYFRNADLASIEEAGAWVESHPITILYVLADPIETPLTAAEIAAYHSLRSNQPTTTIMNNAGVWMEAKYCSAYFETKTDWQADDFFNIGDYNRIKRNLNEIRSQALILWPDFDFEEMGEDKTYQDYGFHSDEINRFEANVDHICDGTFSFAVGERQTFFDNQPFIDWKELNRIERACRLMYSSIRGRIDGRKTLVFTLNGGAF